MELWVVIPLCSSLVSFGLFFLLHSSGESDSGFDVYDSKDLGLIISVACILNVSWIHERKC